MGAYNSTPHGGSLPGGGGSSGSVGVSDVVGLSAALADKRDIFHGYGQAYGYNYGG